MIRYHRRVLHMLGLVSVSAADGYSRTIFHLVTTGRSKPPTHRIRLPPGGREGGRGEGGVYVGGDDATVVLM